jgi:hypothetical protein
MRKMSWPCQGKVAGSVGWPARWWSTLVTFEGYSYSASRDLALRLALHTQIKSWVLVNTLRSPPMQHVKRRLCIMTLLAKDLLAQLEAYFHQCKSLLAASLRLQREGEIVHASQRAT